jgi:dGTPase
VGQPQECRERTEELERASLSSWAALALETKGRDRYEPDDPLRTAFQADRDRLAGSGTWTALAGRSAALPARVGRTRLGETADVVRVARTVARALRLNEDLVEAVAFGHPLGSTPFAGAGEEGLELATGDPYRREEQALRVVERLSGGGLGLNLTWETRDGILHQRWEGPAPATLEADAARFARRFTEVSLALVDAAHLAPEPVDDEVLRVLGDTHEERLQRLVLELVGGSAEQPELRLPAAVAEALERAATAASGRLQDSPAFLHAHARAVHCMASLAVFSLDHGAEPTVPSAATTPREVVDALSACTDAELLVRYRQAFEPDGM